MLRLLHTADLQIGKPFANMPEEARYKLRERRLEALEALAGVARREGAELVLIAGDLFDAPGLPDREIVQAAERLGAFGGEVIVLPGNHDPHAPPQSVWTREAWVRAAPPRVRVALDGSPLLVGEGRAVVLPAPVGLVRRGDPTAHITAELGAEVGAQALRIGLAHGSVVDFTADGTQRDAIARDRAATARLDYLALGDWHGLNIIDARTAYPGTPEPDRFDSTKPGFALVVELEAPGQAPVIRPVAVGRTRWLRHAAELHSDADRTELQRWLDGIEEPRDTLVRLELEGTLDLKQLEALDAALERAAARLLHLDRRGTPLPRPSADELDTIATHGWVRLAVDRLRASAEQQGDPIAAADAAHALELLYRLRVRQDN